MPISQTLKLLLEYSKADHHEYTWRETAKVLAPMYNYNMTLENVLHVLLKAYEEALNEPRFEIPSGRSSVEGILLAPIKGFSSVELLGPCSIENSYTIEQFYSSMIIKMLGDFRCSRIDWLHLLNDQPRICLRTYPPNYVSGRDS